MSPTLRNIIAGVAGAVASIPANAMLLSPMAKLTGAPAAPAYDPTADPAIMQETWSAYFETLDAVHMVGPLLAHWNGAFCGAFVAALIAADRGPKVPLIVAGFVLLGGLLNAFMLPGQPVGFLLLDIGGYLPVGWLGWKLALQFRSKP